MGAFRLDPWSGKADYSLPGGSPDSVDSVLSGGGFFGGAGGGMDPLTLALIDGGSKVLGSAFATSPAGPSRVDATNSIGFDNSGWNVNMGSGSIRSDRTQSQSNHLLQYALIAGAFVLLWRMTKKR